MAFQFIVEDGTGLPSANSFVSTEEADDIIGEQLSKADTWNALEEDEKQRALAFATRTLNVAVDWRGRKGTAEQALSWPRTGVRDADGYDVAPTIVPSAVRAATAHLALHLLANDPLGLDAMRRLDRVKVDVIDISFRDDYVGQPQTLPGFVRDLIIGLGASNANPRFSRIARA